MSQKRNKKKKPPQKFSTNKQAVPQFKALLYGAMKLVGFESYFPLLKECEFEYMSIRIYKSTRPTRFTGHRITSSRLQLINNMNQIGLRRRMFLVDDKYMSVLECNSLFALADFFEIKAKGNERLAEFRTKFSERFLADKLLDHLVDGFNFIYLQNILYLSNPQERYYSLKKTLETQEVGPIVMKCNSIISVHQAQSSMLMIHGINRPVFRLGKPSVLSLFNWIRISSSLLGDHYKGKEKELGVYIQSHALNRLTERLDILNELSLNHQLITCTHNIKAFEFYRGYLLLPFFTYLDVKVGYLAANVVGDKLVFRTFLFVTHNCTPEGDKLKEISGLQKSDIKYWQFDRLSTFASANVDDNPALHNLLKEAGIDDLLKLKDIKTNSESHHENLAGELMAYIERGQKEIEEEDLSENELCMG
jgi:hypothetical protein